MTQTVSIENKPNFREELILSSMFYDPECRKHFTVNPINPELFLNKQTNRLVRAFNDVSMFGTEPTESLIIDQLNPSNEETRKRILSYLREVRTKNSPETLEALAVHIKILQRRYQNSIYKKMGKNIIDMSTKESITNLHEKNTIEQYIENMLYHLSQMIKEDEEKKSYTLTEGIHHTINTMNESANNESKETVTTGYKRMDEALDGGWKKGNFAILAARPGMGKTVVMLNFSIQAARRGVKVLFVSIEMPAIQLFQRVLANIADTTMGKIQRPEHLSESDWTRIEKAAQEVVELYGDNFFVEETTEVTVPQLERITKHYVKTHGVESVFVDYAQIMLKRNGEEPKESSDFDEISGGLRRISKKMNIAMIVGSQLNRKVEEREDKRPVMSDIRNSGAFEQDAGVIIALYRDEAYYKEESERPNIIDFIFLKNRFGQNGNTLEFNYDLSKQKIMSEAPALAQAS